MFFLRRPFDSVCALAQQSAQLDLKALNRRLGGALADFVNNHDQISLPTSNEEMLVRCITLALAASVERNMKLSRTELLGTGGGLMLARKMDSWKAEAKYDDEITEDFWAAHHAYDDFGS